ncbi:LCP family protein [Canibacter zhoujuaniae]|uniref:LCP family protein n=1 Tax=Canibacter zhoujuaniae TaxID=2708343 RepID=UPI00141F8EB2|nr:LCP family protein [Canibacter zhoujuaniae]
MATSQLAAQLEQPLRYPDTNSEPFMTKRARWLVVLGFLLPGTAQITAGKKKLGRFGLAASIFMWSLLALAALGFFLSRSFLINLLTNTWVLLVIQILLIGYAVLWLVLGLDTLRMVRVRKVKSAWRLPVVLLSLVLTVVPALGAGWAANTINAGRGLINDLFQNHQAAVEPVDGRYNILLLGTDAGADREGIRPDSISLVSVDAETGQALIIGLPRNLEHAPFPESSPMHTLHPDGFGIGTYCYTGECYLNHIYTEVQEFTPELYPKATKRSSTPGIEGTKDAVEGATGLHVQFYVLINMDSFERLIDALGGVDINVKEPLPIGGDAYGNGVEGYVEAGQRRLSGFEAIWYARSRYGSDRGDYDRMERQRELQAAIVAQMTPENVLLRFQEIAASGSYIADTDIPKSMLGTFSELVMKTKEYPVQRLELVPPAVDTADPDYATVQQLVRDAVATASAPEETE